MVASAIAYLLTAFFVACGGMLAYRIATNHPNVVNDQAFSIFATFLFFALAWGCAYLGGI